MMRVSQDGIDFIKRHEGFSATLYRDVAGYATIGYGHCLKHGESFECITSEQAESLLIDDLDVAERCLNRLVKISLCQKQFDALASFIYNVGTQAFENSTLLKLLNQGDIRSAATQFERWVYAGGKRQPGLISRRQAETALFCQDIN